MSVVVHFRRTTALSRLLAAGALAILTVVPSLAQGQPDQVPQEPDRETMVQRVNLGEAASCPYCDMTGANLEGQDLTNANLTGARLTQANLKGAILNGALLIGAELTGANFENAKLNPSDKGAANLSRSNLTGANFQGAEMNGTNLQFATMNGTDFSGLNLTRAVFGPRVKTGAANSRKTSFRNARLRREFAVDPNTMDVSGATWEERAAGTLDDTIACGRADLSGLTSRIYVASTGTDGSTCGGSYSTPCKTIEYGIGRCAASGCGVLVAWDEYRPAATIALRDGVQVFGGCLPASQSRPEYFSAVVAANGGQPVVSATSINAGVTLQGFQLNASAAAGTNAATSVALWVKDSARLTVSDVELVANRGGQGGTGGTGGDGTTGGNGSGRNGGTVSACGNTTGGQGSVRRDVSVDNGAFSFTCKPSCSANSCYGYSGSSGTTGSWASGGGRGGDNCAECPRSRGDKGGRGTDGNPAGCGVKGSLSTNISGSFSGDNWVASLGGNGTSGGDGGGGGGGGAGGYKAGSCFWVKTEDPGNTGGGGGAGGCRGAGGSGGQQGGASFALIAIRSQVACTRCAFTSGTGGNGGNGGPGGRGGRGGTGAGGATNEDGGYGGDGGTGGPGGAGGGGAGGNGGPAVGAALVGNASVTGTSNVYYPGQSGNPGEAGSGGSAIVTQACTGPKGDPGVNGLIADTKTY